MILVYPSLCIVGKTNYDTLLQLLEKDLIESIIILTHVQFPYYSDTVTQCVFPKIV